MGTSMGAAIDYLVDKFTNGITGTNAAGQPVTYAGLSLGRPVRRSRGWEDAHLGQPVGDSRLFRAEPGHRRVDHCRLHGVGSATDR
jgi:hypothetical protein